MNPALEIDARPLTAEDFAAFGNVIAASARPDTAMNGARFDRFDDLAPVDVDAAGHGRPAISIVRSRSATRLPYCFDTIERHPLGSQAFVPLAPFRFVVVVAPPGNEVAPSDLRAFVTNGQQGVSYHRGTWHMPLIALEAGQSFLVIDRVGEGDNCEQRVLDTTIMLLEV